MTETLRLDKWLWHARLAKTRSLAARLCEAGLVEIEGIAVTRPARPVRPGESVTVAHGGWRRRLRVLGLGSRRGPAPEARLLYDELAPPERLAAADPDWEPLVADEED